MCIRDSLESLETLGAQIYLYEGNHEVSMEFLSNTIESYKGIAEDLSLIHIYMDPDQHTFINFITKYLGKGWGFFSGWSYWVSLIFLSLIHI